MRVPLTGGGHAGPRGHPDVRIPSPSFRPARPCGPSRNGFLRSPFISGSKSGSRSHP